MLLRTLSGRYAGEIRDYAFEAGIAALKVGTAERLTRPEVAIEPPKPVLMRAAAKSPKKRA